ncbi:MAG: VCBS repeat-containing protein [Asgard group archaeon]|nr:VCBS repeat-containing protein [Asgard group archaeon]
MNELLQQILEEATNSFHSLLTHDFNIDGVSEIIAARFIKNATDIRIVHPKHMSNYSVKINEKINTMCVARTSLERGFELITGDMKGVVRINSRNGRPFFSKDIRDGIRLPSSVINAAPGDLNGNKLSEIMVGCANGEVVMIERIPGKKHKWDKVRGFSLGKIFPDPVKYVFTGDFNGNGQTGFVVGSREGVFKEIEFRPQLQKFDLIGECRVESEPNFVFNGDFDRDGISEILVGDITGKLSIFKRNRLMSTHNLGGPITCGSVGDVDNDRQLEIVVGTYNGSFHILRQNTIESYEGYSNISDLRIGDLNGNRKNELVFSIDKSRIVAFSFARDKTLEKPNVELIPFKGGMGVQPVSQMPDSSNAFCPNCQSQVRFIEQYRRWYCYTCRQYVAPMSKKESSTKKTPMIDPQKHGSPYTVGSPYEPYKPYPPQPGEGYSPIGTEQTGTQADAPVPEPTELTDSWESEPEGEGEVETNYYLPLDLEADSEVGVDIFNDMLKIKHVILIHSNSGVPLFSQGFGKEIDVSLTSGFLSAVGTFTEEMSGETEKRVGVFSEIGREGFWIVIYEGELSKAAFLVSEKINANIKHRISIFMSEFENMFRKDLEEFTGFISGFTSATDLLEKHLRLEYLYPLKIDIKRMRLTAITQHEKQIAKTYTQFLAKSDEEVFYVTELIDIVLSEENNTMLKEDALVVLIKYLENGMLIPLPPPPDDNI